MIARTRPERVRKRLYRRFRATVDGLVDKARARAAATEQEWTERDWRPGGQWRQSHPFSPEIALAESVSGNPLNMLARAIDGVHRGELMCAALVAVGTDGVIHSAWSDGDLETLGKAAHFLGDDLERAARP